jgi:hypothetical protein
MLLLMLMGAGLLGLLLLNTALTEDAFRLHRLEQQAEVLAEQEQQLSLEVDALSDPAALAGRAAGLGLAPGGGTRYLPPGTPVPPGGRVVRGGPGDAAVLVVVPPPAPPAGAAPHRRGRPGADAPPAPGAAPGRPKPPGPPAGGADAAAATR